MKKRILAVLLMVAIVAALFVGLSVTAAAENDITGDTISGYMVAYTMKNGDTVLNICKKLGVDFYKNQALISKVNSIGDYSTLPVGKVLWLPATSVGSASDYYTLKSHKVVSGDNVNTLLSKYGIASTDTMLSRVNANLASPVVGSTLTFPVYTGSAANKMADSGAAVIGGTAAAAAGTATGIATGTGTAVVTPASGSVAYYLVAYTMKQGDTVGAVCTSIGINFNQYSALISRINGITNYNRIPVGRVVLLPSGTATGTSYSVVAHQILAGETANSICASYGVSLANNLTLVKGLNNTNNLNYIQAGGILYVPVPGATPGPGPGPDPGPTPPTPGTAYKLSKDDCDNGSFVLKVGGAEAASAAEGSTVTIVCQGASGYAQQTVTAHMTGDTSKKVTVTNNTFVMPDFNVTVKVTFGKATMYAITRNNPSNGSYDLLVDEKIVTDKTYAGAAVTISAKPNPNYAVGEIKVYKTGDDTVKIPVTNGKFTMPQHKVTVELSFKAASNYEYPVNALAAPANGTFNLKVDGVIASKAASGKTVTVAYKANDGYKLDNIYIHYPALDTDGSQITKDVRVSNAQFKMPSFDEKIPMSDREVLVEVQFILNQAYTITLKSDTAGSGNGVFALVEGTSVTGYEIDTIVVKGADGTLVKSFAASDLENANGAEFTMPAKNIVITPTYKAAGNHQVKYTMNPSTKGTVTFNVDATILGNVENTGYNVLTGKTVNLTVAPNNPENFSVKSVKAYYTYNGEKTEVKITGNNFTMPSHNVTVEVELERLHHAIETTILKKDGTDITSTFTGKIEYYVNTDKVTKAVEGDNVVIKTTMPSGYKVKNIKVEYKDGSETKEVTITDNTFKMPGAKALVTVKVDEGAGVFFNINIADTVNGQVHVENSSGEIVTKAEAGTTDLKVVANPDAGYKIGTVEVKSGGSPVTLSSDYKFTMPGAAVNVKVTFVAKNFAITPVVSNGTLNIMNEYGESISKAEAGDTVKFAVVPDEGYKFDKVTVTNTGGNILFESNLSEGSFEMPAEKVTVTAYVVKIAADLKVGKYADFENGTVSLKVNGTDANFGVTVKEGDTIQVIATPLDEYQVASIKIHYVKSGTVLELTISDAKFIMPNENVKVEVIFTK